MFELFKRQSITTKLTLLMMLISIVLLVIVSLVVLVAEVFATRTALIQELRMLSSALTASSRQALVLGRHQEAEKLLSVLGTRKNIHAAYFFDRHGEPIAEYLAQDHSQLIWDALKHDFDAANHSYWRSATTEQVSSSLTHLAVFTPVFFDGARVGSLYLLSDLDALYGRISGVAFGITLSLMFLFVCSWLLAGRLQKPISRPLLDLADIMETISEKKTYSLRATRINDDEIGLLVDGLNHMLEQIELQQQQQERLQQQLELTVERRTSELRSAVTELERARQQAVAANEAKSQFLSRMTHELRTPLIGILGMNGLLQRTALDEQQKVWVETVGKSGEDLLALISDVLDHSRIEAGKLTLDSQEIEPCQIVEEVIELLSPQAQNKGLTLLVDIPLACRCRVRGDRARIWQIMLNLIGNAIKFTPAGTVMVRVRTAADNNRGRRFVIEVEDTGIGMDEGAGQRVFDLFFQLDPCRQASNGSGLGLTIVKQLVDLMGGTLSLTSIPGEGSTFRVEISLPVVDGTRLSLPAALLENSILLGLAHRQQASLLARQLQELGFRAARAESPERVVEMLHNASREQNPYTMLFVCQQWFFGEPLRLCETLQNHPSLKDLKLHLLVSSHSVDLAVPDSVTRLCTPVTWGRLFDALSPVRAEEPTADFSSPPVAEDAAGHSVLFVGRHAAVRELLRLSLSRWQVAVDSTSCLDPLGDAARLQRYLFIVIDAAEYPAAVVEPALAAMVKDVPCYLLGGRSVAVQQDSRITGYLRKPLNDDDLALVLKSFSIFQRAERQQEER